MKNAVRERMKGSKNRERKWWSNEVLMVRIKASRSEDRRWCRKVLNFKIEVVRARKQILRVTPG